MSMFNEHLDNTHEESDWAKREIRTLFMKFKREVARWEMTDCPPRPERNNKPAAVWLDEEVAVPVTRPEPDPLKIWNGDDPLLRPRPWLR